MALELPNCVTLGKQRDLSESPVLSWVPLGYCEMQMSLNKLTQDLI